MNWRENAMRSKTSFFNGAVLRQTAFRRYWPVWAIYAILLTWGMIVALFNDSIVSSDMAAVQYAASNGSLSDIAYGSAPVLAIFAGLVAALCCFGYLHNARATQFYHALPVGRAGLFFSQCAAGVLLLCIPILVCWLAMWVVLLVGGGAGMFAAQMFVWLGAMVFSHLFFFAFGVLIGMLTGNIIAHIVYYAVFNFLSVFISFMVSGLFHLYLYGYNGSVSHPAAMALSPLMQLMSSQHLPAYAIYCAVGVGLLALAVLLYRKRRLEVAGDVIALKPLRPVFIMGFAVCFSFLIVLFLGWTFGLFSSFSETTMTISLIALAIIGYYIARMLAYKTFRVFSNSWKGALGLLAGMLALTLSLQLDVTGFERRIPPAEELEYAAVYVGGDDWFGGRNIAMGDAHWLLNDDILEHQRLDPVTGDIAKAARAYAPGLFERRENIELAQQFHLAVVDTYGKESNASPSSYSSYLDSWYSLSVRYVYKDGRQIQRQYNFALPPGQSPVSDAMTALHNADEFRLKSYLTPGTQADTAGAAMLFNRLEQEDYTYRTDAKDYAGDQLLIQDSAVCKALMQAVMDDLAQGNIGTFYPTPDERFVEEMTGYGLSIGYTIPKDSFLEFLGYDEWENPGQTSLTISLTRNATHTLEVLRQYGVDVDALLAARPQTDQELYEWFSSYHRFGARYGLIDRVRLY